MDVMLTGFAENSNEKATAETLTWQVDGVKAVKEPDHCPF